MTNRGAISRRALLLGKIRGMGGEDMARSRKAPGLKEANERYGRGDWAGAEPLYREYLRAEPDNHEARRRLGRSLYHLGKHVQARVEFERVLRKEKEDLACLLFLGLCLARLDKADRALEVWKRHFDPTNVQVQRELNLQQGLADSGQALSGREMAEAVEAALFRAEKGA